MLAWISNFPINSPLNWPIDCQNGNSIFRCVQPDHWFKLRFAAIENELYLHRASGRHCHPQPGSREVESHFGLTDCQWRTQTGWTRLNQHRHRSLRLFPWHWLWFFRGKMAVWFLWWRQWSNSMIWWRRKGKRVDKVTSSWGAERARPWPLPPWQVLRLRTNGFNGPFLLIFFYIFNICKKYIC